MNINIETLRFNSPSIIDSSSSLLPSKNAQTSTPILHYPTTVHSAKTESLFIKTLTSIQHVTPTNTLQDNIKLLISTHGSSNPHSSNTLISGSIAIKSMRPKLLTNHSKASLISASINKVVKTKQISASVRFSSSLDSRKATEAATKEINSIKEQTSLSTFVKSRIVAESEDTTVRFVPTTSVAYYAGQSEQTAKELKIISVTKSLFVMKSSTQSKIGSNSLKVGSKSSKTIKRSQSVKKSKTVYESVKIAKSKTVEKSKDNTKSGTNTAQSQKKRMNSNTKTLLYAGIPILVAFVLFLLLILTKNSHGFGRLVNYSDLSS